MEVQGGAVMERTYPKKGVGRWGYLVSGCWLPEAKRELQSPRPISPPPPFPAVDIHRAVKSPESPIPNLPKSRQSKGLRLPFPFFLPGAERAELARRRAFTRHLGKRVFLYIYIYIYIYMSFRTPVVAVPGWIWVKIGTIGP